MRRMAHRAKMYSSALPPQALPALPSVVGTAGAPVASDRMLLRDGSVANLTTATPRDRNVLLKFFNDLSPESRHKRFLSLGEISQKFVDSLCQPTDPTSAVTLVAWRHVNAHAQPIAVASY